MCHSCHRHYNAALSDAPVHSSSNIPLVQNASPTLTQRHRHSGWSRLGHLSAVILSTGCFVQDEEFTLITGNRGWASSLLSGGAEVDVLLAAITDIDSRHSGWGK